MVSRTILTKGWVKIVKATVEGEATGNSLLPIMLFLHDSGTCLGRGTKYIPRIENLLPKVQKGCKKQRRLAYL